MHIFNNFLKNDAKSLILFDFLKKLKLKMCNIILLQNMLLLCQNFVQHVCISLVFISNFQRIFRHHIGTGAARNGYRRTTRCIVHRCFADRYVSISTEICVNFYEKIMLVILLNWTQHWAYWKLVWWYCNIIYYPGKNEKKNVFNVHINYTVHMFSILYVVTIFCKFLVTL